MSIWTVGLAVALAATNASIEATGTSANMPTVLITGSNRGIGLEFARQYAERGWRVIATCRNPAKAAELNALARARDNLIIEPLDIASEQSVADLAERYRGQPIDVLINNAALLGQPAQQQFPDLDFALFEQVWSVNAMGTLRVIIAFQESVALGKQKKIVALGSSSGSVSQISAAPNSYLPYRASKAGLHLLIRNLSYHLAPGGIRVALLNPGLVDTRGVLDRKPGDPVPEEFQPIMPLIEQGVIELDRPADAVADLLLRIDEMDTQEPGQFLNADGTPLPW